MEFRILGPLDVRDGGRPVEVRGRRQRALLALLLIRANEAVSDERLLDGVWGDDVPESGTTAVRVRVSQLRKALGTDVIATRSPGYALEVDPERIDAYRFERLFAEGRRQLAAGDAASAAATLRQALALWRGPALADFEYEPFAEAERARLEDLRLAALEERIEADLELHRHSELVGELDALVPQSPYRERLRAQLMLALYRCGRQADALAAYRDARRTLVDELGIEPSPSLQQLERAILRQEDSLAGGGRAVAAPAAVERKVVTVIAAEFDGESEADPERARALLERVRAAAEAEIDVAGGRVEATVGGTLVATFGAPVAQEDHAQRALTAAVALRRRIEDTFGDGISTRIGAETGEAVVDATVAGTPVRTAMRLAQAGRPGEILAGERTVAAARAAFEFGKPRAHGRPLERALSVARGRAPAQYRTTFVGREHELGVLLEAYRDVADRRRPRFLTVVGEAGVGKSRLLAELRARLAAEGREPAVRSGRCLPYGRATTYSPLGDVLREELGLLATDSPDVVIERLGTRRILGLTLGLDVTGGRHPLTVRDELHEAWVDVVEELVAERPAVILIEDLHWAQEPLLDVLERLVRSVRGPLFLIATARPELSVPDERVLRLEPLSDDETALMLADIDERLRARIVARAEGNPFFAEELLAGALETGSADLPAPDSIHSVLAARIDRLPPTEKAAVQAGAVVGRSFWRGAVCELLDGAVPDFALLQERDFVRARPTGSLPGDPEFAFKHALTRDVAYASLPRRRRARLHAALAEWLERVVGSGDEQAASLAHHYFEAVRPEDADLAWEDPEELEPLRESAGTWLRRAAAAATGRYELDQAITFLENALQLAQSGELRCELWRSLGRVHALRHDGEAFWTALERALDYAQDDATRGDLYAELAFETCNRSGMWVRRPEAELVEEWVRQALAFTQPDSRARGRALITQTFLSPGDSPGSAEGALEIATRLDDPALLVGAWDALRVVALVNGDWDRELAAAERRRDLLDRTNDPDVHGDVFSNLVPVYVRRGRFEDARTAARRTDEVTRPLSSHHRVHGVAVLLEASEAISAWDEIHGLEERVERAVADNVATPCVRNARSLLVCALANAQLGHWKRADELEEQAEAVGLEGFGHVLDTPRIRLALARGDLRRVEELVASPPVGSRIHVVGRAFDLVSWAARLDALAAIGARARVEEEAPRLLAGGAYLEPFAFRALGAVRSDEGLLAQALERFESLGLAWEATQTRAAMGYTASRPT